MSNWEYGIFKFKFNNFPPFFVFSSIKGKALRVNSIQNIYDLFKQLLEDILLSHKVNQRLVMAIAAGLGWFITGMWADFLVGDSLAKLRKIVNNLNN